MNLAIIQLQRNSETSCEYTQLNSRTMLMGNSSSLIIVINNEHNKPISQPSIDMKIKVN